MNDPETWATFEERGMLLLASANYQILINEIESNSNKLKSNEEGTNKKYDSGSIWRCHNSRLGRNTPYIWIDDLEVAKKEHRRSIRSTISWHQIHCWGWISSVGSASER